MNSTAIGYYDHQSVLSSNATTTKLPNKVIKKSVRKLKPSSMVLFGKSVASIDWSNLYRLPSCQDNCDLFYNLLLLGFDKSLPIKIAKVHCRDKPWIALDLKRLVFDGKQELAVGNRNF